MKRCFMCLSDNSESELSICTQYEPHLQKIQTMWHVLIRWFSIALVERYAQSLVCRAFSICKNLSIVPRLSSLMILGLLCIFSFSDPPTSASQGHSIRACPSFLCQKALLQIISYFPVSSVSILSPWCRGCIRLTLFGTVNLLQ